MEKTVLHTQDLGIGYRSKKQETAIASNITVSLEKGKLISLIGANGIGKSTLLRTLTGIQQPLWGKVFLDGKEIGSYPSLELSQKLSLVLTEKLPAGNLTVFELVALGRQPYTNWIGKLSGQDIAQVNQALELTGTSHLAAKKHYQVSDGQLQNVLVARALAQDTPLIVLDEPTTHLDLQHKAAMFRLLRKLSAEIGKCILFSTHDIDMAIQLSDEIIVMTPGKITMAGPRQLIADGAFDNLFPDNSIVFDREKGRFVFRGI